MLSNYHYLSDIYSFSAKTL